MSDDSVARLREYLGNGGFFNPELMDHAKVRDMVIDCRVEIKRLRAELAAVRKQHDANGKASRDRAEHIYKLRTKLNAAEAERDALRALLREAREYVADMPIVGDELLARIDAALKGDGDE